MSDIIAWTSLVDALATAKYGKILETQSGITTYETSSQGSTHSDTSQRHTPSPITWNSLVDDLATAKHSEILEIESDITMLETSRQVSTHSDTSQRHATAVERDVRTLDHQRCFVTNKSGDVEVTHILDNCNAGNGRLASASSSVDALRGLGIVHHNFNLDDVSNLLLMSRNLRFVWNKYAAFIIVPSTDTRKRMIEILAEDRPRIRLALNNKQAVEPHQLAYPEPATYDIILVRPSLFGNERQYFQRADNHDDDPTYYRIPVPSDILYSRLEYLTKQDDEAHVSEFLNISHVTGRSSQDDINPYLMIMNALPKLEHWYGWGIGDATRFRTSVPDPVFATALEDCEQIMAFITTMMYGAIHMSRCICDGQAQGCKEDDVSEDEGGEGTSSASSRDLEEEPESPPGSGRLHHDPSVQAGTRSWISRGGFDKTNSLEHWRQDVSEFSDVV